MGVAEISSHSTPATIKWLKRLIWISVVVSAATFAISAWLAYRDISEQAKQRATQTVRMAEERALKIFKANEVVLARVRDLLAGMDDRTIRANERALHMKLKKMIQEVSVTRTLAIWDQNGSPLVSSNRYPVSGLASIDQREYFLAQKHDGIESAISESVESVLGQSTVLVFSRRRARSEDNFTGIITASLYPTYITDFYKEVFGQHPEVSVSLVHSDSTVLARHPPFPGQSVKLPTTSRIAKAMQRGVPFGFNEVQSAIDGKRRLIAFLKVGGYPVYSHVGIEHEAILSAWYGQLREHALFLFPAIMLLLLAMAIALREARREQAAINLWQQEMARRAAMQEELRQAHKLEAIGDLTGGLAHDFNNLLSVIHNYAQLLQKIPAGADACGPVTGIQRAVDRGQNITRHLLRFSHRQSLQPVVVDLGEFVPEVCELLRHSLPSKIALHYAVAPETWPIKTDRAELELALLNVVMNSRDAMEDGGTILIKTANIDEDYAKSMSVALPQQDCVAISIVDHGHGIPADVLGRIFDPFFTTKECGKGTGLGLSRVYGFAKQSGGTVTAESPKEGGAVITIYLPRCERSTPIITIVATEA
ncbi:MAG TPA: ATP-binding protein, partial [Blastocatellia bacterium]|nr:ATP-binding protein [Blastocatellia bacterium]